MSALHPELDKVKLLHLLEGEYAFVWRTLQLVPKAWLEEGGVCGDWSVKDLVAHLAVWIERTLRWLEDAERGIPLTVPEAGYRWNEFDQLNHAYYEQTRDLSFSQVTARFQQAHTTILEKVAQYTEEELAGGGRMQTMFIDSPFEAIYANTAHHYTLHVAQIRTWLNQVSSNE